MSATQWQRYWSRARNEAGFKFSKGRIPWAGNRSQADHKRNNYAIQTRKLSHSIARSAGKSNRINFLEGNFPQDTLYLGIVIIILHVSSNHIISKTFSLVPEVKSAEKPLHEHEVETTTSFVMYYSYGVGKGKSKVRGASYMNSAYERECWVEGCRGVGVMGRPRGEGDPKTSNCSIS